VFNTPALLDSIKKENGLGYKFFFGASDANIKEIDFVIVKVDDLDAGGQ